MWFYIIDRTSKIRIVTVLSKLVCYSIAFIDLDVCIYILHSLELITTSEWALVTATNCIDLGQATCLLCFVKTKSLCFIIYLPLN
jgi:hypothetical protein